MTANLEALRGPGRPSRTVRWLAWACLLSAADASAAGPILFRDVTPQTGITFRHTDGSSGERYIMETVSAGLALFDYDSDGDVDIYFLNGAPLQETNVPAAPTNALYRNDGDWRFTDVTDPSGAGDTGFGLGVAVGDYDNDGNPDLYLNNFGANVLYRNNGDGSFTDMTAQAGVANGNRVGAGACFFDMAADGDLDLYVASYVDFTYQNHRTLTVGGYPAYAGPISYPPAADTLYRNNGDGTFTDVSVISGVAAVKGTGMGVVCADYDGDGDTDVIVGNDMAANFVFENNGSGKFQEVGLVTGLAYDFNGKASATMGVECGDYDNDGRLDFHMTSYRHELAILYRNTGGGLFEDVTRRTGAGEGTFPYLTWGNGLVDFDNDGHRDLFVACGHLQDNIEKYNDAAQYLARNIVLRNTGTGKFVNVSDQSGDGLAVKLSSRGAAFDDLDNDGDVDAVILNSRREPPILRNDTPPGNHWIQIQLRGVKSNRDGVGASVKVTAGDLTLIDEVHSGRGYQSHYGTRLQFGLGQRDRVDRIEVRWIGGGQDILKDVQANQLVTIVEGGDQASRESLNRAKPPAQ